MTTKYNWPEVYKEWQDSGKSVAKYARDRGIHPCTLYSGFRKRGLPVKNETKFIRARVVTEPDRSVRTGYEIELPNRIKIRVNGIFDLKILHTLLSTEGGPDVHRTI